MDYKSPIESIGGIDQIIECVKDEFDNNVYKAVLRAGVQVDKSELIRALQYDRDQYLKGYSDAKAEYDRGHGHWIYNTDEFTPKMRCSVCGYNRPVHCVCNEPITSVVEQEPANFCNNCGAEMDEEVEE